MHAYRNHNSTETGRGRECRLTFRHLLLSVLFFLLSIDRPLVGVLLILGHRFGNCAFCAVGKWDCRPGPSYSGAISAGTLRSTDNPASLSPSPSFGRRQHTSLRRHSRYCWPSQSRLTYSCNKRWKFKSGNKKRKKNEGSTRQDA